MVDIYDNNPSPILPAILGWSNEGTSGGANARLYATDRDMSPRWAKDGGRTIERAIIERDGGIQEGDRYLVVRIGNRFTPQEVEGRIKAAIVKALGEE